MAGWQGEKDLAPSIKKQSINPRVEAGEMKYKPGTEWE
jgi:hypothetical protein